MAKIIVEYKGKQVAATKEQLFAAAAKGLITPETRLWYNGTQTVVGRVTGIRFPAKEQNTASAASATPATSTAPARMPNHASPTAPTAASIASVRACESSEGEPWTPPAVLLVIATGFFTSFLSVLLVYLIGRMTGFDAFSVVFSGIIPISSLLFGAMAGTGYLLTCRMLHFRPTWPLIVPLIAAQTIFFLGCRWAEYRAERNDQIQQLGRMYDEMEKEYAEQQAAAESQKTPEPTQPHESADESTARSTPDFASTAPPSEPNASEPNASGPNASGPNASGPNASGPNASEPNVEAQKTPEPLPSREEFLRLARGKYPGFWTSYRAQLRGAAASDLKEMVKINRKEAKPLGAWGYALEALVWIAFCASSLVGLFLCSSDPYCTRCRRYMEKKRDYIVPAGGGIDLSDPAAVAAMAQRHLNRIGTPFDAVEELRRFVAGPTPRKGKEVAQMVTDLFAASTVSKSQLSEIGSWLSIVYASCPKCPNWELTVDFSSLSWRSPPDCPHLGRLLTAKRYKK